jgi:hypothetical protein
MMTGLGHDLRDVLRQVRRNPGFAAADSRGDVLGSGVAYGVLLGLLGALISVRVMRTFLYEVEPADPRRMRWP